MKGRNCGVVTMLKCSSEESSTIKHTVYIQHKPVHETQNKSKEGISCQQWPLAWSVICILRQIRFGGVKKKVWDDFNKPLLFPSTATVFVKNVVLETSGIRRIIVVNKFPDSINNKTWKQSSLAIITAENIMAYIWRGSSNIILHK